MYISIVISLWIINKSTQHSLANSALPTAVLPNILQIKHCYIIPVDLVLLDSSTLIYTPGLGFRHQQNRVNFGIKLEQKFVLIDENYTSK